MGRHRSRDATQTIQTFCPAFGRPSRVVGRPADYWCFLSALVGAGDWRPDRVACFKFYRSVLRGFGYRCSNRDGFGRALWTSKFRGLSPSVEQDRRCLDNRADARLFFGHILGRGTR